jgi:NAD(P)-dependent dehydrogenase (short-subunit alcohol dehydrogenase family)
MASLGGAGESVALVAGAGELGSAMATLLAGAGFTVVVVDRTPNAQDELPEGIRREVGDTTDQAMAKTLIDRIAGEAGPLRCWRTLSAAFSSMRQSTRRPRTCGS